MSSVAVRPPRFLGERGIPTREQTVQERLQESLPGYTIEKADDGYIAKSKPVKYLRVKDVRTKKVRAGTTHTYASYSPHELRISSEGEVQKEIKRGTYNIDATGKVKEWGVYEKEVTDYEKQTRFTYGTRDMKSGRETVRRTSSLVGGEYKEKRIIDQDSADYERLKRTPEQAELIRKKGFTVRRTEEYAVAGMSKEQRREYYRLQAQRRSAQFSLEAKAQKIARQETEKFRSELGAESQKYAMDIVAQQEARRPKTQFFVKTTPGPVSRGPTMQIIPETPSSPTTRMDLADKPPFITGSKLTPGELKEAPKAEPVLYRIKGVPTGFNPEGVEQRYQKFQDLLSQKQARAGIQDKAVAVVGLGASQFVLGVPVGVAGFGRAVLPWNLPETVSGMVNPASYRALGQQLSLRPARTAGEITGTLLAGYGVGKGIQYARIKKAQAKRPAVESVIEKQVKTRQDAQTTLQKSEGRFTGRVEAQEMQFAKVKPGKGQVESTVFSAKVVKDPRTGQYIRTPEIGIVRHEIPGDPTRLGTIYKTKKGAYTGKPIRVRPEVQQPLSRSQVVATSKWLPGDVRPVTVKYFRGEPTPYVSDMFGGSLRKFNPQEFTLSTIYPGRPGLQPSQASAINIKKISYTQTFDTPLGRVTVRKPPSPGVQTQLPALKPKVITIVKKPGATSKPLETSVVTPTSPKVTTDGGSRVVASLAPQRYAPASQVIKGSVKVYPKTKLIGKAEPVAKLDLPESQPLPKADIPVKQSYAGLGLVGVIKQPKVQVVPKTSALQPSPVIQEPGVQSEPVVRVDVSPESLAKYRDEVIAVPESVQVPEVQPVTISQPVLQTETVTELRTETVLRTEPLLEPVTELAPISMTAKPAETVPLEPPPELAFVRPPVEEREKKRKYKVQVREKGLFKDIAIAQTPEEAFKIGAQKVLSDSTASLRVQDVSSGRLSTIGRSILPKKMFRESKKEPGVFIEKRKFRIDAPQEKKEITFKGILASKSRSKNIFKR